MQVATCSSSERLAKFRLVAPLRLLSKGTFWRSAYDCLHQSAQRDAGVVLAASPLSYLASFLSTPSSHTCSRCKESTE